MFTTTVRSPSVAYESTGRYATLVSCASLRNCWFCITTSDVTGLPLCIEMPGRSLIFHWVNASLWVNDSARNGWIFESASYIDSVSNIECATSRPDAAHWLAEG